MLSELVKNQMGNFSVLAEGRKGQFETLQYFPNIKEDIFWKPVIYWFFLFSFIVVDIEHNQPEKVP